MDFIRNKDIKSGALKNAIRQAASREFESAINVQFFD